MSTPTRVAVITGASQGIGAGLVRGYRRLGYAVVANSRSIGDTDDPLVLTVAGDISEPGVGQRIIDAALQRFGCVDTVVNNAGIFIAKPFTDYTDTDYDAITGGVNMRGFFELTRAAMRVLKAGGHVVNISTSLVDQTNSQVPSALASLTKGGLNAATKALAIEYAGRGIRVNAVALGVISTPRCTIRPTTPRWRDCIPPWVGSARSMRRSRRCCTWSRPAWSPVRSSTWTGGAKVPDIERLLRSVLDQWRAGIDEHNPPGSRRTVHRRRDLSGGVAPVQRGPSGSLRLLRLPADRYDGGLLRSRVAAPRR